MRYLWIILLVEVLILLSGCSNTQTRFNYTVQDMNTEDYSADKWWSEKSVNAAMSALEEQGLVGEHALVRYFVTDGLNGSISGRWYFLGGGKLNGQIQTGSQIQFAWRHKSGSLVVSSLPVSTLMVVADPGAGPPTIRFKWDLASMDTDECGESIPLYGSPNKYINPECLSCATIRITPDELEREIYLKMACGTGVAE